MLQPLIIPPTYSTLGINFNAQTGVLEVSGRSIPERANSFYEQLYKWLKEYLPTNPEKVVVNVTLDYINSSSHKYMVDLFAKLKAYHTQGGQLTINWRYEDADEEIRDTGEEFSAIMDFPFNYIIFPES